MAPSPCGPIGTAASLAAVPPCCRRGSAHRLAGSGGGAAAAPAPGLRAAPFDEFLEALGVALSLPVIEADSAAGLLRHAGRLPLHLDGDPGVPDAQAVEGHHAGVRSVATDRLPSDPIVR